HNFGPAVRGKRETCDLAQRVDPGVGPPGALYPHLFPAEGKNRLLDILLHRRPVGLALPADEGASGIPDRTTAAGHQPSTSPLAIGRPFRKAAALIGPLPAG